MAQREIPIAGVVPEAGDKGETGYQLSLGGGATLPFTQEQLEKQGLVIDGDRVVYKEDYQNIVPDITITGKLGTDTGEGKPTGENVEGTADILQPEPTVATQPQAVPEQAPTPTVDQVVEQPAPVTQPTVEAPVEQPAPVTEQVEAPAGVPSDADLLFAERSQTPPIQAGAGFGDVNKLIDEAIQGSADFLQGRTEESVEASVSPDAVIGEGRPLLLPREASNQNIPSDYYTRMFFTDQPNPNNPEEPIPDFTVKVHDNFRNAVGFRKPLYDPKTRQFVRDTDGNIVVDDSEFGMIEFTSDDLDERTAQFIQEGGYALQTSPSLVDETGQYNLYFAGDILDAEIVQRSQAINTLLSTPIYRYMSEKGGADRVRQVLEANGVPLADTVYTMRRLENSPIFAGQDLPRLTYTVDNSFGGVLSLGGLTAETAVDTTNFLASWTVALMAEVPELASALMNDREAETPVIDTVFFATDEETDAAMAKQVREARAKAKSNPIIEFAIDMGWDATQRYAEDHGLNYEQARAALMANRGFVDTLNWFFMENLGFSGPILALRAKSGKKAADALDDWLLETYGDARDRRLYNAASSRPEWDYNERRRSRFEVIQNVIARAQDDLGGSMMEEIQKGFRQSKQYASLSKFGQQQYANFWMREGFLAQSPTLMRQLRELEADRKKVLREYKKQIASGGDPTESNKTRSKLLSLNKEIAQIRAEGIMPKDIALLTKGEASSAIFAAAGYAWAYEMTDNPTAQDLGTFLAIASGFTKSVQGVARDGAFGTISLLATVPGVRAVLERYGIAPPPKKIYEAQKTLREVADPKLAAVIQSNLDAVGQTIITAEEINRQAGKTVIDTSLFIQGLSAMSGLTRVDAAIQGITSNPKMGEVAEFGDEVMQITEASVQRISLTDQLTGVILQLKEQVKGVPSGSPSANILQEEIAVMEDFVRKQNEAIEIELSLQEDLWKDFGELVEDVLMSGDSAKYMGTELERLAQESTQGGNTPFQVLQLIDRILDKDVLASTGMSEDQIERVGRASNAFKQYVMNTQSGLEMLEDIFNKTLLHLSEFREGMPEGISQYSVNWITKQHQVSQRKFIDLYNGLDEKYGNHRISMTTPFRMENDKGEVIEIPSLLEYLQSGDFHLTGVGESLALRVEGRKADQTVAAVHGLMEESATATLDAIRKRMPESQEAFEEYINQINAKRLAEEKPLLDPSQMTALDQWKYMGEALVEFELVSDMAQYQATYGRLGLRTKDYRVLVSHLGASGATAKGFAQYSHHELRAQFVKRADNFEGNFFDVNMGEAPASTDPTFKKTLNAINDSYSKGHLDAYRNDRTLAQMMKAIEDGQEFKANEFFSSMNKRFGLDTDNPDLAGFQKFWARVAGTRNEAGEFVIDLDTDAGKQVQTILTNWGTSLLTDTVAGQRALALKYNASLDVRARINVGQYAGDPTAGRQIAAQTGIFVPKSVPELQVAYQEDLPWSEIVVLENIKGVVTVDGKKVEVPIINLQRVLQPIMPESVEGGALGDVLGLVKNTNQNRVKAAMEAKRIVRQELQMLKDVKTDVGLQMDMYKSLWLDLGKGLEPKQARQRVMSLVAAGPGGADRLARFKKTYVDAKRAEFLENNPTASLSDIAGFDAQMNNAYNNMLKDIAIDYLFDQAATAGAQTTFKGATGEFITANPAVIDGKVLFELLGFETRGGGISDRGLNFQSFFEGIGRPDILNDIKFVANQLFEAGPDGNIRISNLPTPINLNHVATRVVAGLRGQVSPRWLIIEHVLRQRSVRAGELFMTMMTDPEVGEALIELATRKDLTPEFIESKIDVLWRVTKHAAKTEYFEQEILPALDSAQWQLQRATAPAEETED